MHILFYAWKTLIRWYLVKDFFILLISLFSVLSHINWWSFSLRVPFNKNVTVDKIIINYFVSLLSHILGTHVLWLWDMNTIIELLYYLQLYLVHCFYHHYRYLDKMSIQVFVKYLCFIGLMDQNITITEHLTSDRNKVFAHEGHSRFQFQD